MILDESLFEEELKETGDNEQIKIEPVEVKSSQADKIAEVNEKDQGVVDNVMASAVRDLKRAKKVQDEVTKPQEAPKHDEKPKNPKMASGAKKLMLDESLFEDVLKEGAGAGYNAEGIISEIKVNKILNIETFTDKTAFGNDEKFAKFTIDATGVFDGWVSDYYGYGAELVSAPVLIKEIEVNANIFRNNFDEETGKYIEDYTKVTVQDLNDELYSGLEFESKVIGAGWIHTTFTGKDIEANISDTPYTIDSIKFDFTDKNDIDSVEYGLTHQEDEEDDINESLKEELSIDDSADVTWDVIDSDAPEHLADLAGTEDISIIIDEETKTWGIGSWSYMNINVLNFNDKQYLKNRMRKLYPDYSYDEAYSDYVDLDEKNLADEMGVDINHVIYELDESNIENMNFRYGNEYPIQSFINFVYSVVQEATGINEELETYISDDFDFDSGRVYIGLEDNDYNFYVSVDYSNRTIKYGHMSKLDKSHLTGVEDVWDAIARDEERWEVEYDRRAVEQEYNLEEGELDGLSLPEAEDAVNVERGELDRFIIQEESLKEGSKTFLKDVDKGDSETFTHKNRFNYDIKQVRTNPEDKTYEIGQFTYATPRHTTHSGKDFDRTIQALKDRGYTEKKKEKKSLDESIDDVINAEEATNHVVEEKGKITILGKDGMLGSDFYFEDGKIVAYNFELGPIPRTPEEFSKEDLLNHLKKLEGMGFEFIKSDDIKDTTKLHINNTYKVENLKESIWNTDEDTEEIKHLSQDEIKNLYDKYDIATEEEITDAYYDNGRLHVIITDMGGNTTDYMPEEELKESAYDGEKKYKVSFGTGTYELHTEEVSAFNEQEAADKAADQIVEKGLDGLYSDYYELADASETGETVDEFAEENNLVTLGSQGFYFDLQGVEEIK